MATRFSGTTISALGALLCVTGCGSEGPAEKSGLRTVPGALSVAGDAMDQEALGRAVPNVRLYVRGGRVVRLYGTVMATGATPSESAEAFRTGLAAQLGAEAADLVPVRLRGGQLVRTGSPSGEGLMPDPETGKYRFWLYRYAQVRSGVPVHGAALLSLVENTADHPVVWAGTSLRDLGALTVPRGTVARPPNPEKARQVLRPFLANSRDARGLESALVFSEPELVIYAGTGDEIVTPRLASSYVGSSSDSPGKWRLVAENATGAVLDVEDLVADATVGGRIRGYATQGHVASQCAAEVATALPYAEVSIAGGASGFTNSLGYYWLSTSSTNPVTVVSPIAGRRFDVFDFTTSIEELTLSVTPPTSSANFMHNQANTSEHVLAQVNGYVLANQARNFLLGYLPAYPTILSEENFPVNVNRSDYICPGNGWYDSDAPSINTCRTGSIYANTAFGSFIQHEYGHHIINMGAGLEGNGGPYGEGMADSIAVSIANDARLFVGLLQDNCNVVPRSADNACQYSATSCSTCGGYDNPWGCGMVLSGIIWDIREALAITHPTDYRDIIHRLMLSSIPLHAGLTTIGPEIAESFLILDDDDGNLDNGTPHRTEICQGFALHGIQCPALPGINPCAAFCSNPLVFSWGSDYQSGPLGTGAICRETTHAVTGGNCGNFAVDRKLYVNGTQMVCNGANWSTIPAAMNGGYCVTTTAGDYSWAFFTLW